MKRLVADTGPFLHLHEAGALHLLPLVGEVFVPHLVLTELNTHAQNLLSDRLLAWVKTPSVVCNRSATLSILEKSWSFARRRSRGIGLGQ